MALHCLIIKVKSVISTDYPRLCELRVMRRERCQDVKSWLVDDWPC